MMDQKNNTLTGDADYISMTKRIIFEEMVNQLKTFNPLDTIYFEYTGLIEQNIDLSGIPNNKNVIFLAHNTLNKNGINVDISINANSGSKTVGKTPSVTDILRFVDIIS